MDTLLCMCMCIVCQLSVLLLLNSSICCYNTVVDTTVAAEEVAEFEDNDFAGKK